MVLELQIHSSTDGLEAVAAAWDDLWRRSDAASPTLRSAPLVAWKQDFAPRLRFSALTVRDGDQLVAALPLVDLDSSGLLSIGAAPNNYWTSSGDLLLDPEADGTACCSLLVSGLRELPWSLVRLAQIEAERPAWRAFLGALEAARVEFEREEMYRVGRVRFEVEWSAYHASRSQKHRANMRRGLRMAEERGGAELRIHDRLTAGEVEPLLWTAFGIEDRSWKGRNGTSVLRTEGMFDHYLRQARLHAESGHLRLVFLDIGGEPVAFEYSYTSKGHYITPKAGYDEAHAKLSPGQLLCHLLYQRLAEEERPPVVDLVGPLNDAERKWTTEEYSCEALSIAVRPIRGRAIAAGVRGFKQLRSSLRRARSSE